MELSIAGESHCAECGQSEFLPLSCPHCEKKFCPSHRGTGGHKCTSGVTNEGATGPVKEFAYSCFLCGKGLPVVVTCVLCSNICCPAHREPSAHACSREAKRPVDSAKATPAEASKPARALIPAAGAGKVPSEPEDPEKKAKNDALRRKVALTKMKVKCPPAKGMAPEDALFLESEYLAIPAGSSLGAAAAAPVGGAAPQYHCVSSRTTTVAQLLDLVAAAHKAANRNSSETDPNQRLQLYVKEPGAGAAKDYQALLEPQDGEGSLSSASPFLCRLVPDANLKAVIAAGLIASGDTVVLVKGCYRTRR